MSRGSPLRLTVEVDCDAEGRLDAEFLFTLAATGSSGGGGPEETIRLPISARVWRLWCVDDLVCAFALPARAFACTNPPPPVFCGQVMGANKGKPALRSGVTFLRASEKAPTYVDSDWGGFDAESRASSDFGEG